MTVASHAKLSQFAGICPVRYQLDGSEEKDLLSNLSL